MKEAKEYYKEMVGMNIDCGYGHSASEPKKSIEIDEIRGVMSELGFYVDTNINGVVETNQFKDFDDAFEFFYNKGTEMGF